ncbi:MAG: hypothetical protein WBM39_13085 [Parasphingorhabdus sp.]
MNPEPPLLIIASIADDLDLAHLPWSEPARARVSFNSAKFKELEIVEVIVDGMPFLLSRLSTAETAQKFSEQKFEQLFCGAPSSNDSAIGVGPRDMLISARHLPEVNHRLLLLGKWIGESLAASAAAWVPSGRLASFSYFEETVAEYLAGGPFPSLFQTSFAEIEKGLFVTRGLNYFTGQEVRLTAPSGYSVSDVAKRLVRIITDIATRGKIESPAQAQGIVDGETLNFLPSDDLAHLDITITNRAIKTPPASICSQTRRQ